MTWEELTRECAYEPVVERPLKEAPSTVVLGAMGGSSLAARAVEFFELAQPSLLHQDYGLPKLALPGALYIAISYSGTTEETVSFANEALRQGLPLAIIASGGTLADLARREGLPYAAVPSGYQPRYAFFFLVRALLALLGNETLLKEIANAVPGENAVREEADEDAKALVEHVPVFYASGRNLLLAELAKLVMNESAHMPAFAHAFPEMNHEELESYDRDIPEGLEHLFLPYLFSDEGDSERIMRRMDVFEGLLSENSHPTLRRDAGSASRAQILVRTWLRSLQTAGNLAEVRGIDPSASRMVAELKKRL